MPVDLVGAAVGYLLRVFADTGVTLLRGPGDRRALETSVRRTIDAVVAQADPPSRERLRDGLRQCFTARAVDEVDTSLPLGEGVRAAIAERIALLAGMSDEDGLPFYDGIQVDQDWVTERVTDALLMALRHHAAAGGVAELTRGIDSADMIARLDDLGFQLSVMRADIRSTAASVTSLAATTTLPADTSSFTGRTTELDRLLCGLDSASTDIVEISAIDGMAGVGKSAFAIHAAHALAPRFPDARLFVRLHAHSRTNRPVAPADALESLLLTVGVAPQQIPSGTDERAALWRSHLAGRRVLLVLDDATGTDQVLPLLPGSSRCLVLITSRHHLAGLPDASSIQMDVLAPDEATDLFLRLAGRPELDAGDPAVAGVVDLCGRLPLALSIAAGQLKHHHTWTAGDLAAELTEAVDRLAVLHAEDRSVAAAFDLTYRNLDADQRRLFRRLGLHPGPEFDSHAAAALDDADLRATARRLDELYAYHVIEEVTRRRYRLHDLIRSHAQTLANTDPAEQQDAACDRLLDYYLYTAQAARQSLARHGPPPLWSPPAPRHAPDLTATEDAARWMEAERPNLHAATEQAATRRRSRHAVGLPAAMAPFLRDHGHWGQALTLNELAAATARANGDRRAEAGALDALGTVQLRRGRYREAAWNLLDALELCAATGYEHGEAETRVTLAAYYEAVSAYPDALAAAGQALELYSRLQDRHGEAETHAYMSGIRCHTADYADAAWHATSALEIQRQIGDRRGEAASLRRLAIVQLLTVGTHDAVSHALEALDIDHQIRNLPGMADTFDLLARCYRPLGLLPNAEQDAACALGIRQRIGDRRGEADTRHETALNHARLGAYETAIEETHRALAIRRDIGDRSGEAASLTELGELCRLTARYEEALRHVRRAQEIRSDIGDRYGVAACLCAQGRIAYALSRYEDARGLFGEALDIRREIGDRDGEAELLSEISLTDWRTAQYDRALANAREALRIRQQIASRDGEAQALINIAQVLRRQGRYSEALLRTEQALAIRRDIGDRRGEAEALEIITMIFRRQNRYDAAEPLVRTALEIRRDIGDSRGEAEALDALARVKRNVGEQTADLGDPTAGLRLLHEAGDYAQMSYRIRDRIGDRRGLGDSLHTMATTERDCWALTHDSTYLDQAAAHAHECLRINRAIQDLYGESAALNNLTEVHLAAGDLDEALRRAAEALRAYELVADLAKQARVYTTLSRIHTARGDHVAASRALDNARALWPETDIDDEPGDSR